MSELSEEKMGREGSQSASTSITIVLWATGFRPCSVDYAGMNSTLGRCVLQK